MKTATIKATEEQLRLIQKALDFYSRVGIGQMWAIKEHPTFEKTLRKKLSPVKPFEVGDSTERGEIVEIQEGCIKTKCRWNGKEEIREWKDVENIRHSIDYELFHDIREHGEKMLCEGRNLLLQENYGLNASYGIHNENVDESCRAAFDMVQVIRHEFWKENPQRSSMTVDSSIHFTSINPGTFSVNIEQKIEKDETQRSH